MEAFREYMIGIKGPLTTPIGGGIRSLNVALRQTLDLYVCLRPVRWFRGVVTPVKEPEKVDMYIFRENTEDIYAGIEWQQGTPEARKFLKFLTEEMGVTKVRFPETSSFGVKPVSVEGTERLVRAAIEFALANRIPLIPVLTALACLFLASFVFELGTTHDDYFIPARVLAGLGAICFTLFSIVSILESGTSSK